jgi:hypothetical protein
MQVIPTPFVNTDGLADLQSELSIDQIRVSRTVVLDIPRQARVSCESTVFIDIDIDQPGGVKGDSITRIRMNINNQFLAKAKIRANDVTNNAYYTPSYDGTFRKGHAHHIDIAFSALTIVVTSITSQHLTALR